MMEWHGLNSRLLLLFYATTTIMIVVVGGYGSKARLEEARAALLNYKSFLRPHDKSVETSLCSWVNDRNSDCCEWKRITCDPASHRVIHLSLHSLLLHVGASSNSYEEDPCLNSLGLNFSMFKPFKELRSLDLSLNCFNHSVFTPGQIQSLLQRN